MLTSNSVELLQAIHFDAAMFSGYVVSRVFSKTRGIHMDVEIKSSSVLAQPYLEFDRPLLEWGINKFSYAIITTVVALTHLRMSLILFHDKYSKSLNSVTQSQHLTKA